MITRFFGTSKPIHFVLVILITFFAFIFTRINNIVGDVTLVLILEQIGFYAVIIISFFILDFLVGKNNLTKKNNYKLLLFALFLIILPITMQINNVLIANLFILLALRRIISLRTNLKVKTKLFDAAFWIGIASLFYFWAGLFFFLIIIALFVHSLAHLKNWIIPIVGLLTVAIITIGYLILMNDDLSQLSNFMATISFDFVNYKYLNLMLGTAVIVSLGLWSLFFYLKNFSEKSKRRKPSHILIIFSILIAAIIILVAPNKNGSECIFIFAPLSIVMANYLESIKKNWVTELFVWILIVTPIFYLTT